MEKLNDEILRRIGVISRAVNSLSDIKYKEYRLQKGQFVFLTRVCENPGSSFSDITHMLKVDKTTTTKAVQKLIEASYIEKRQDVDDRRLYRLWATQKGLEVYDRVIEEENRNIERCLKGFAPDERELINRLLERMKENISSEWDEGNKKRRNR